MSMHFNPGDTVKTRSGAEGMVVPTRTGYEGVSVFMYDTRQATGFIPDSLTLISRSVPRTPTDARALEYAIYCIELRRPDENSAAALCDLPALRKMLAEARQ
jgi:hypothetical protein